MKDLHPGPRMAVMVALLLLVMFGAVRMWPARTGAPPVFKPESARVLIWMEHSARETGPTLRSAAERIAPNAAERAAGWFYALKGEHRSRGVESDALFFIFVCAGLLAFPAYGWCRLTGASRVWAVFAGGLTAASPVLLRRTSDLERFALEIPVALIVLTGAWLWQASRTRHRSLERHLMVLAGGALIGWACGAPHAKIYAALAGVLIFLDCARQNTGSDRIPDLLWVSAGFAAGLSVSGYAWTDILSPSLAPWYACWSWMGIRSVRPRGTAGRSGKGYALSCLAQPLAALWIWIFITAAIAVHFKSSDWMTVRHCVLRIFDPAMFPFDPRSVWSYQTFPEGMRLRTLIGPDGFGVALWLVLIFWREAARLTSGMRGNEQNAFRFLNRTGWICLFLTVTVADHFRIVAAVWVSVVCARAAEEAFRGCGIADTPAYANNIRRQLTAVFVVIAVSISGCWSATDAARRIPELQKRSAYWMRINEFLKEQGRVLGSGALIWSDWRDGYWLQYLTRKSVRLYDRRADAGMRARILREQFLLRSKDFVRWLDNLSDAGVTHVVLNNEHIEPRSPGLRKKSNRPADALPLAVIQLERHRDRIRLINKIGPYRIYKLSPRPGRASTAPADVPDRS